jgi:beta-fructofuranosidase
MFSILHPARYTWDFWYYFDPATSLFYIFYLNAEDDLVPTNHHHFAARVGMAKTYDFMRIDWGEEKDWDILKMPPNHWANTSIWSGDIVRVADGFLLFFTSRNRDLDDGMTQNIGVAYTTDLASNYWEISPWRLPPDRFYQKRNLPSGQDLTTHAWRDPFLFREDDRVYMLLSAKIANKSIGKNGAIALLTLKDNDFARGEWEYLDPIVSPDSYSEMEVSQLYRDPQGNYELVFSTWAKFDFAKTTRHQGGLQGFTTSYSRDYTNKSPHVLMPESSNLYACRIVPELDGEIVGFDTSTGGIRRSGLKTHFSHVDRNFSDLYWHDGRL